MKKLTLMLLIVYSGILIYAQECKDVIYPTKGLNVIFDCCIKKVKDGNIVHFKKNDTTFVIEAISIIKDGQALNLEPLNKYTLNKEDDSGLYEGHDYHFYANKYNKASKIARIGWILCASGATLCITSAAIDPYSMAAVIGWIVTNAAIPIWISGAAMKSNNRKAMLKTQSTASISFRTTNHGVGFVLNF